MALRRLVAGPAAWLLLVIVSFWAAPPLVAQTISGTVTFWGESGGTPPIEVAAHLALDAAPQAAVTISVPGGPYTLTGLADGAYYVSALLDRDDSGGPPDPYEPLAWYDADADGRPDTVTVSNGEAVTDKNLNLGFIHVDVEAMGANNGSSWADAYTDLVDGIAAAVSGLEVWVAEGTYKPGSSRTSTFSLKNGVRIYGGFAGGEATREERRPASRLTILSGDIGTVGTDTDNVYHVVTAAGAVNETAVLDGFTVTKGYANGGAPHERGAGLYSDSNFPTIANVVFLDNWASSTGGGVYAPGAPIRIYNSSFLGNHASFSGGGFYGGNYAQELVNSVFSGNSSFRGGGIYISGGSDVSILRDLTISGNSATLEGGGIFHLAGDSWTLANSVVWGNTGSEGSEQIGTFVANIPVVTRSIVQGGYTGTGSSYVLDQDPLFVDADGGDNVTGTADDDLHLQLISPAIDAGDNALVTADLVDLDDDFDVAETLPLDRDYRDRFYNVVSQPDTGSGTPPIVDMGAFEAAELMANLKTYKYSEFNDLAAGQSVLYIVNVENDGPEDVSGAQVTDILPTELTSCSWVCDGENGATCTPGPVAGNLSDSAYVPVNSQASYGVTCTVSLAATGTVSNTATVAVPSGYLETDPSDNSATEEDPILAVGACGQYPDNRVLDGVYISFPVTLGACKTFTATNVELDGADVTFVAGEWIALGNEFWIVGGATLEIQIDPSLKP